MELACQTCIHCMNHGMSIVNLNAEECDEVMNAFGGKFTIKEK